MKFPIIIRNSIVPRLSSVFINVYAITLFPFIFIKDEGNPRVLNHESIHIKQQAELLVLFFYVLYVFDWLVGLVKYRNLQKAYSQIRFEQEAYAKDMEPYYLIERKKYAWRKYKV